MAGDTETGTPTWLRTRNERQALEHLLEHGALTRTELGRLTGLSKPTTAQIVSRLEQLGLVEPVGTVSGGPGPNAVSYAPRARDRFACAVDISAETVTASIVDPLGTEHPVAEFAVPSHGRTPEGDVRIAIEAAGAAAGVPVEQVHAVGVGVQAAVAEGGDHLSLTDTLGGWPEHGARTRIERSLGVSAWVENDVNLAAVAERAAGTAQGVPDFAYIWLGAGVGVALDFGGRIHRGASGMAGELGYLAVPADAAGIDPRAGDITDLVGGPAIQSLIERFGGDRADRLEDVLSSAAAARVVAELGSRIATAIAPVLAVVDPALVVLGGPTAAAGGSRLAEAVEARLVADGRWHPPVATSGLDGRPVLAGVRRVLLEERRTAMVAELAGTGGHRGAGAVHVRQLVERRPRSAAVKG